MSTPLAACRAYLWATLVLVPTWTGVSKPGPSGAINVQWLAVSSITGLAILGRKAVVVQPASPFPAQMVLKGLCKCFMLAAVPTLLEGCQNLLEPARAQCLWLCPALSGEREYTQPPEDPGSAPHGSCGVVHSPCLHPGHTGHCPTQEPGTDPATVPSHLAGLGDPVSLRQWDETWGCLAAHLRSHWQKCSFN